MKQSSPIRIIIVDDHPLLRDGIRYLCLAASDVTLVGEAANGEEALVLCNQLQPDVVLMDLMMPGMNGIATTKTIREQCPDVRILVLTSFNTQDLLHQAIEAGANGYVLKDASTEDILNAIRLTYQGMTIMSSDVTDIFAASPADAIFTPRQMQVLKLMIKGLNNTQIGKVLKISPYTVRFHVSEILGKLGVSSRVEAVAVILQQKLLQGKDL